MVPRLTSPRTLKSDRLAGTSSQFVALCMSGRNLVSTSKNSERDGCETHVGTSPPKKARVRPERERTSIPTQKMRAL